MKAILFNLFLSLSLAFAFNAFGEVSMPNIVFIMADDLGPGWVDYDGSNAEINTPNLEQLARRCRWALSISPEPIGSSASIAP